MTAHRDKPCHKSNYTAGRRGAVKYLVVHYVGAAGSARNNAVYYGTTPNIGASAHYFVGHAAEGGAIWASVAEEDTAWHCGTTGRYYHPQCRNANSIGVELCCHKAKDGTWYFDEETVEAAVELCRDIVARYRLDKAHMVRHSDVTHKVCPAPFVLDEGAWQAFKDMVFREEESMDEERIRAIVREELAGLEKARAAGEVDAWAREAWDRLTVDGVFDGSRPRDYLTRQEAAVVLERLEKEG